MKIKIIEDGNLTSSVRLFFIVFGIGLVIIAIESSLAPWAAKLLLLLGFGIGLVGGMASQAHMLKIKPFDSSYKKARESYQVKDEEEK